MTRIDSGEYRELAKYLRDRYADRVVLTFAQIEDLLGFPLCESARIERAWWEDTDSTGRQSTQSSSWVLANRTATVNLTAKIVLFERSSPPEPAQGR
jgi:hypothetical protein